MSFELLTRDHFRQHKRLVVIFWLIYSVSWNGRWVRIKSGRCKKLRYVEKYQVVAPIRKISVDCNISPSRCAVILNELKTEGVIKLIPVSFGRKNKHANIVEIAHPTLREWVDANERRKLSSTKLKLQDANTGQKAGRKARRKLSTTNSKLQDAKQDYYNIQVKGAGDSLGNPPAPTEEVPPWLNA